MTTPVPVSVDALEQGGAETQEPEAERLTEDDAFHLLQNERRRRVLAYLRRREGEVRMRDVAEQVAAWEHGTTVENLDSNQRQRVYIPLYQDHLPKLDELGVIEYDQSRGIVERTERADQLHPYLDIYEDASDDGATEGAFPWVLTYLGVAGAGTLLLAAKAWGLSPVAAVPDVLVGAAVVLLFTATSCLQLASEGSADR